MMLQLPEERRERKTQKEQKEIEKQQYLKEQAPKKRTSKNAKQDEKKQGKRFIHYTTAAPGTTSICCFCQARFFY